MSTSVIYTTELFSKIESKQNLLFCFSLNHLNLLYGKY